MLPIKDVLQKHTIVILNEALKHGFTQLPNYVLKEKRLSFGAKLTYAVLLSYAWEKDSCFPGQERIAQELSTSERSIRRFLVELKDSGFIDWKQQGLNKPNIYYILDYRPLKIEAERTPVSGQERTKR